MEDYGTSSFIQAFIRFSCEVGYPKTILIDEGSQLKKGCDTMLLNFQDIKMKLSKDCQVTSMAKPLPKQAKKQHSKRILSTF